MVMFGPDDDLSGARFERTRLHGARVVDADASGLVMRGVDLDGADLDSPWLAHGTLLVNGVDVVPLVEAELDRRFPGRAARRATEVAGLRSAWESLRTSWAATVDRVLTMPPGTPEASVDGEWSFAETLRHLVFATDVWLGRAILGEERFHPLGVTNAEAAEDGFDVSVLATERPTFAEVLEARAEQVARVTSFLDALTPEALTQERRNPWAPDRPETTLSCLHVILGEEWEHLRYAVRDLDAIDAAGGTAAAPS